MGIELVRRLLVQARDSASLNRGPGSDDGRKKIPETPSLQHTESNLHANLRDWLGKYDTACVISSSALIKIKMQMNK